MTPVHPPVPPPAQRRAGQANDLLPLGDWIRHHALRSWPVLLFLVLICVPSIALVVLGLAPSASTFDHVAWIFAAYFAVAWLLLLGVIIRPEHVTRPMLITHACWAGLTGYFIGLAASGRHRWYTVSWIGLAAATILHGLNDWSLVNGHLLWIVVTLVSGILFLGYAKVGSRTDPEVPRTRAPAGPARGGNTEWLEHWAAGRPRGWPAERPSAMVRGWTSTFAS